MTSTVLSTSTMHFVSATEQPDVSGTEDESSPSIDAMDMIMLPLFGTVCIVGLLGNALIMYIMQFKIRQKSITDIYVTNLAVADFIFLAMLPFWTIDLGMDGRWLFGRWLCKLTSGLTHVHMYASVFFLTAMSVDRLMAVVFYKHNRSCRHRMGATVGSAAVWVFSLIISTVPFCFRDLQLNNQTGYHRCTWIFQENVPSHRNWYIVHFLTRSVIGFALPFVIIAACYTTIAIFLKTRNTSGRLASKRQDRATTMVMVVIGVFLVCWLPNQISNVIYALQGFGIIPSPQEPSSVHYHIHMFSTCLAWGHSCINPILYAFMREDLKLKMTEVLHAATIRCCGSAAAERLLTAETPRHCQLNEGQDKNKRCNRKRSSADERAAVIEETKRICDVNKASLCHAQRNLTSCEAVETETVLSPNGEACITTAVR